MKAYPIAAALALAASPALAQEHDHSAHAGHDTAPAPEAAPAHAHGGGATGALGGYPMVREASGTSWQPDVSEHGGLHAMRGGWMLMGHAVLNGVYVDQQGPRGDRKAFVSGMLMGSARRDFASGDALNLRLGLAPDPFMGRRGYPLLLAAGETADGRTPLVDRQHPHDLFMELSASYSRRLTDKDSLFLYAGLPGEPAFGPPTFMHRLSAMDSPEAPISHHWLDSTHITFGVLTAGFVHDDWKLEASSFSGREPDERRYGIEQPKLNSSAVRLSWNPTERLSLQGSWASLASPEALEPDMDETRWSASAIYTVPLADGWWSTTAAWGRKDRSDGAVLDAYVLESAVKLMGAWTLFGRAEQIETDELDPHGGHGHGTPETAAKLSLGAVRDFRLTDAVTVGVGGLYTFNQIPAALEHAYGDNPNGAMGFVRLKVGG